MKSLLTFVLVVALGAVTAPVMPAAPVAAKPLTPGESRGLALEEAATVQELAEVEAGSVGTFLGLVVLAGAVVVAAIVISDDD